MTEIEKIVIALIVPPSISKGESPQAVAANGFRQ